jgi:hypothetical protein
VVLDHIADGADGIVKGAAVSDIVGLRHGDLHAIDVVAVPDRFEQ